MYFAPLHYWLISLPLAAILGSSPGSQVDQRFSGPAFYFLASHIFDAKPCGPCFDNQFWIPYDSSKGSPQ